MFIAHTFAVSGYCRYQLEFKPFNFFDGDKRLQTSTLSLFADKSYVFHKSVGLLKCRVEKEVK